MLRDLKETLRASNPSRAQLRRFGMALALVLAFVAYRFGFFPLYYASATAVAAATAWPHIFRPVHFFLVVITFPIGWITSRVFLVFFFFMIITPIAVSRRLLGYDPLKLKHDPEKTATCWEDFEENINYDSMGL